MANTLTLLGVNGIVIKQISINANTDVKGVWYDGLYYWTCEGTVIAQNFLKSDNTLQRVYSFDMNTKDSTITRVDAICGDSFIKEEAINFWIAVSITICVGEICEETYGIKKIDKRGNILRTLNAGALSSTENTWNDLCMDGLYLYGFRVSVGGADPNIIQTFDVSHDTTVDTIPLARILSALTYDGRMFYGIRDAIAAQLQFIDRDGLLLNAGITTNVRATGADFNETFIAIVSQ